MTYDPIDTNDDGVVDADVDNQSVNTENATIDGTETSPQFRESRGDGSNTVSGYTTVGENQQHAMSPVGTRTLAHVGHIMRETDTSISTTNTSYTQIEPTRKFLMPPLHSPPNAIPILTVVVGASSGQSSTVGSLAVTNAKRGPQDPLLEVEWGNGTTANQTVIGEYPLNEREAGTSAIKSYGDFGYEFYYKSSDGGNVTFYKNSTFGLYYEVV